ncbi:MAG: hypothetical protein MJZ25_09145 [Fibrobacter sp.]|nr:hypothetical protein [Fibrobacter sp.]
MVETDAVGDWVIAIESETFGDIFFVNNDGSLQLSLSSSTRIWDTEQEAKDYAVAHFSDRIWSVIPTKMQCEIYNSY